MTELSQYITGVWHFIRFFIYIAFKINLCDDVSAELLSNRKPYNCVMKVEVGKQATGTHTWGHRVTELLRFGKDLKDHQLQPQPNHATLILTTLH